MRKILFLMAAFATSFAMMSCSNDNNDDKNKTKQQLDISVLNPIVENYADVVVLPTYKTLKDYNDTLYAAVSALCENPTNKTSRRRQRLGWCQESLGRKAKRFFSVR